MLIMEGIGFYRHGGPEVLERIEAPDPRPGNNDVIIRSIATSVNRIDLLSRAGYHGLEIEMPHFPGSDIIGMVERVGKDVDNISVGEKELQITLMDAESANRAGLAMQRSAQIGR